MKTRLIFIEGPDGSGKTTLINRLKDGKDGLSNRHAQMLTELKFNKATGGLLRMHDETHFEMLRTLLPKLDKKKVYIVDRCYISNLVYDRVLRSDQASQSYKFREWVKENCDVLEIVLDRPYIEDDFEDDLLDVSQNDFNKIIDEYRRYYGAVDLINIPSHYETIKHNVLEMFYDEDGYDTALDYPKWSMQ